MSNSRTPVIPVVSDPELKVENVEPIEDPAAETSQPTLGDRAKGLFTSAKSNYILVIVVVISICIIGLIAWYVVKKSKPGILDGFMKSKPKQETGQKNTESDQNKPEPKRETTQKKKEPEPIIDLPSEEDIGDTMRMIEERRQSDEKRKKQKVAQSTVVPPVEQLEQPVIVEQPEQPVIVEQPEQPLVIAQPEIIEDSSKIEDTYAVGMITETPVTQSEITSDDTPVVTVSNGICAAVLKNGQPCKNKTKTRFCHIHSAG